MRWSKLTIVLGGAIALGCASPELNSRQLDFEEQVVRNQLDRWATALNNSAQDSILAMYSNDENMTVVWIDGRLAAGYEEQEQAIKDFYNNTAYLNFVPQSAVTDVLSASVAVTRFRHSTDMRFFDTRREVLSGHVTLVWKKDGPDGPWKIFRQHISINPPGLF